MAIADEDADCSKCEDNKITADSESCENCPANQIPNDIGDSCVCKDGYYDASAGFLACYGVVGEDFDELGVETIDPKLTVLWRATDDLTVRASRGSSFRVGSIQQLFGTVTTVHNMTDYDAGSAYKPSLTVGNDSLSPETTDMWNVGFSYVAGGAL